MSLKNISYERLQEIEQEREQTQLDPAFHSWMQQFKIGKLCVDQEGLIRAKLMMQEWKNSKNESTWGWM